MPNPVAITITTAEAAGVQKYEDDGITQLEIKDVEKLLRISRNSAQKLIDSNQLPSFKVGPVTKIPIAGFKKFVAKAMSQG